MTRKHSIALGCLGLAAVLILPGCGQTTTTQSTIFSPTGSTKALNRLDFFVDNNQSASDQGHNPPGQNNTQATYQVKSFILAQFQNSSNTALLFAIQNLQLDSNKNPVIGSNGFAVPGSYVYWTTAPTVFPPGTQDPNSATDVGIFDPSTYTYTPPAQIRPDPADSGKTPLDTFGLTVKPDNPNLAAATIIIHLNVAVTISPNPVPSINVNTTVEQPPLKTQQFTAPVPGDGFDTTPGSQVTWAAYYVPSSDLPKPGTPTSSQLLTTKGYLFMQSDGQTPVIQTGTQTGVIPGLFTAPIIDPTKQYYIATTVNAKNQKIAYLTTSTTSQPFTSPLTLYIMATSNLQSDKYDIVPIQVNASSVSFSFQ